MRRPERQRLGFTISELMVAMVIVSIVTAQVLLVAKTQGSAQVSQGHALNAQQDARLVTSMVLDDIRMAGFLVPAIASLASVDGGAAGADMLCTSDPSVIAEASVASATQNFDRAQLFAPLGGASGSAQLIATTMDVDQDGNNDFSVNSGIIISDGTSAHCARILGIAGNVVSFTPATPAGFSANPPAARAVPAVAYELVPAGLTRNTVILSPQVEDIQIEYGVDVDGSGRLDPGEFPIHDLSGLDPSLIRRVRLSVITRTVNPEPDFQSPGMPAAANRLAGPPDGFKRRRFTTSTRPRNLR